MQESVDVPIPCLNAFFQRLNGDAVSRSLVQGTEMETGAVTLSVFQIVSHRIESDFVSAFQEFFQA